MAFFDIIIALLLLLQEMSPFFRVLALGPALLSAAYFITDVLPVWRTQISYGTIPGVIQWAFWLALFPIWWRGASTVRSLISSAYWMLAIVAVSCTFRPWAASLLADEEVLKLGVFADDKEPLFSVAGLAIDIPPFWTYPFTAYFLSRVDVGKTTTRAGVVLEGFVQEISKTVARWFLEGTVALAQHNEWARSSPIGAFPIDSQELGAPIDNDSSVDRPIASQGDEAHTTTSQVDGQREFANVEGAVRQEKEINRLKDEVDRLQKALRSKINPSRGLSKTERLRMQFASAQPEAPLTLQSVQKRDDSTEPRRSFQISAVKTMFSILPTPAPVYRDGRAQTDEVTIPAVAVVQVRDAHVQTIHAVDTTKSSLTVTAVRLVASVDPEEAPGDVAELTGSCREASTPVEHVGPSGHGQEVRLTEEATPSGHGQEEMPVGAGEELLMVQSSTQTHDADHLGSVVTYESSVVERQRRIARLLIRRAWKVTREARMVEKMKQKEKSSVDFEDTDIEEDTVLDEHMTEPQAEDGAPAPVFDSPAAAVSQECDMEDTKEEEEEAGDEEMADSAPEELSAQEPALPAFIPQWAPQQTLPDYDNFFPVPATPAARASSANTTSPAAPQPSATQETRVADSITTACEPESVLPGEQPRGTSVIPGIGPARPLVDSLNTEMKTSQLGSSGVKELVAPPPAAIPSEQAITPTVSDSRGPAPASAATPTTSPAGPYFVEGVRQIRAIKSKMTAAKRAEVEEERKATEARGLQSLEPPPVPYASFSPGQTFNFENSSIPGSSHPSQSDPDHAEAEEKTSADVEVAAEVVEEGPGLEAEEAEGGEEAMEADDHEKAMEADEHQEAGMEADDHQEAEELVDDEEELDPDAALDDDQIKKHFERLCDKFLKECSTDKKIPFGELDMAHVHDSAEATWKEMRPEHENGRWADVNPTPAELKKTVNEDFGHFLMDNMEGFLPGYQTPAETDRHKKLWQKVWNRAIEL
ncbi:hypothetical protein B0T11DRAFT_314195 [Plectosphaerella cucumerina]|uniref:Uncharacterized protein n=1 Tax=Plectosphaerella cucumerina TaxID=40658 RepID=A0A8K0TPK6_9PEZI|nr:hypothetical protein B0T11DRAFT_314195 [Plectosphaerella cucumerina]